jgi:hypothetical protein
MIVRVLGVFAIGALAMYFLDPVSGRRRRALLRDQLAHARHERDRAHSLVAEARRTVERRIAQRRRQAALDTDVSPEP